MRILVLLIMLFLGCNYSTYENVGMHIILEKSGSTIHCKNGTFIVYPESSGQWEEQLIDIKCNGIKYRLRKGQIKELKFTFPDNMK